MSDFAKMGEKLLRNGKAEELKAIADSADGRKLSKMLDATAIEKAAKSGDTAALQDILKQVLSTGEGQRLAKRLQETMNGK